MPIFSKNLIKQGLLLGGCLILGGKACAGGTEIVLPSSLPYPGVSLYGLGGNGWTGIADAMVPFMGHSNGFLYVDPQFYYHSDDGYTGSVGLGYRRQVNERTGILGAYVFGDYNRTPDNHSFWFISPGIERLGQIVDFSVNAYLPVSTQRINTGTCFADEVGDSSQIIFSGHDQFDALVDTFTAVGYGGDAQIGVHLPFFRNSEVFLGGYYFAPKDTDSIGGGSVRLQIPVNRYLSVLVSEAYDSEYHNTVKAGLTLWFGGRSTGYDFTGNLAERLVDPVQRNLVIVAGGSSTGQPAVSDYENTGQIALELSNISFFIPNPPAPGAVNGDGTYENPYVGLSQDNVDDANAQNNRNFYVNSGLYTPVYEVGNDYIILNNDQVYGRQNGFREAAQGSKRPLIEFSAGGFEIPVTDTNDSLIGLQLTGANTTNAGIWINHDLSTRDQTVTVDNSSVQYFGDGIDLINGGSGNLTVNVNNSLIANNNTTGELFSPFAVTGGVAVVNNLGTGLLQLNMNYSTVESNERTFTSTALVASGGLAALNLGTAMELNSKFSSFSNNKTTATDTNIDAVGGFAAVNASLGGNMTVNAKHSSFSGNEVINSSGNLLAAGGLAIDNAAGGGETRVNISGSSIADNFLSNEGGGIVSTGGGLALYNAFVDDTHLIANVSGSAFFGNSIDNANVIFTGGGLAYYNASNFNTTDLNVNHSSFTNNSVTDYGVIDAAGGLAIEDTSLQSDITVDVNHSNFSKNTFTVNLGSVIRSAGGLAVINRSNDGTMTLDISDSSLSGNTLFADQANNMRAAGGLAIDNRGGLAFNIHVKRSSLSGNTVYADNNSFINSDGGFAVSNTGGSNLRIDIEHSMLDHNTISGIDGSSIGASGGLAIASSANNSILTVNVNNSSLSDNTVSLNNNSGSGAAGGVALVNNGLDTIFNINIRRSRLDGNSLFADNNGFFNAAGGLALYSDGADFETNIKIDHSDFSGNTISADNNSFVNAAGGLAIFDNVVGNAPMDIKVDHSNFNSNTISANNTSTINSAGGMALAYFSSDDNIMTVKIDHSSFSDNMISVNGGSNVLADGGMAVVVFKGDVNLNINHSIMTNNSALGENIASAVTGGVAVVNINTTNLAVEVENSKIIGNSGSGIAIDGLSTVTVDKSIIAWNQDFGLSAANGATINVTNPIFFDGVVNVNGGIITFPTIGSVSDQAHIVCPLFSDSCTIISP